MALNDFEGHEELVVLLESIRIPVSAFDSGLDSDDGSVDNVVMAR